VVCSTVVLPAAASILMRLESLQATNTAPAPATICSHPCGVSILERTCPVEGSIRIAVRVDSVHTDPDPTAKGCAPTTAGFAGNTSAMLATTSPVREICTSELPLRAHNDPNPETSTDGSGTETLSSVGEGEGVVVGVVVGVGLALCGRAEVAGGDDALEHAASSTAIDARYEAVLIRCNDRGMDRDTSGVSSPAASDEERPIVRDGDRVERPAYPWAPTVHSLLRFLRANGFEAAPEPLDLADGRETLRWIPGTSGADGWAKVVPEQGLRRFARFLRSYHDVTEGFTLSDRSPWAFRSGPAAPGEVICHGDFGPWNVVWREGEPVGLLDFDFAGPGARMLDVAYALEYVAPFCDDDEAVRWRAYTGPPDRRKRISIFAEAYGLTDTGRMVDAVIRRQELDIDHVRTLAARGFEPQRSWVRDGHLDELAARVRWSREHRALFG
jgi:Phosphotransferase enzyme family